MLLNFTVVSFSNWQMFIILVICCWGVLSLYFANHQLLVHWWCVSFFTSASCRVVAVIIVVSLTTPDTRSCYTDVLFSGSDGLMKFRGFISQKLAWRAFLFSTWCLRLTYFSDIPSHTYVRFSCRFPGIMCRTVVYYLILQWISFWGKYRRYRKNWTV